MIQVPGPDLVEEVGQRASIWAMTSDGPWGHHLGPHPTVGRPSLRALALALLMLALVSVAVLAAVVAVAL